jgi:two-component system response regulator HydG
MTQAQPFKAPTTPRVLIVDDDIDIQDALKIGLQDEGYQVESRMTGNEGLDYLKAQKNLPDVIICDLKLPDINGLEFIEKTKQQSVNAPIILITAHATVETAAQALKQGAFDYIAKPINPVELSVLAGRAIKLRQLETHNLLLKEQLDKTTGRGTMLGRSPKMKQIFTLIDRVAEATANVLITGESGTGKEKVARALHEGSSSRKGPFVAINCSAIPEHLLESELFGHRKGAFTGASENRMGLFEEADGGTLFLDEIGDMPLTLQPKLLRVLQERKIKPIGSNEYKPINVRLIAATHRDLRKEAAENRFREDLYFRISVIPVAIPPLRERVEDIPLLAEHFLDFYCRQNSIPAKRFSKAALQKLMKFSWPGNVRELENSIERAVILSDAELIDEKDIRLEDRSRGTNQVLELFSSLPTLDELERRYMAHVLAETGGHRERAAEILGINRKTLYRKEKEQTRQPA